MAAVNRIVFMGTPDFAVPSLRGLLAKEENVVCVVTQPDRPQGRGRKILPPPVKELAAGATVPVLQPETIRGGDFLSTLKKYQPDLIVLTAYGKILPADIINLPPLGTINVHASLLPKYRGAAPIQWAVINGETETGVTIMQMDEGVDTGDILLQKKIPIEPDDTAGTLSVKLAVLGGSALLEAIDLLRRDQLVPVKQDDSRSSRAPMLKKEDGLMDWNRSAQQLSCLIRGLGQAAFPDPGVVCRADRKGLLVTTGKDCLLIKEIQAEGSRRMDAAAFISGHPIQPGTFLGR